MDQGFSNSSESDFDDEYDSEGQNDTDNGNSDSHARTSPDVSDDDNDLDLCVPDLKQNPIKWTQNFQTFNVPPFTRESGPVLPTNWNPKSTPHDYFQLFWTDELLNDIVRYTNQYASLAIMKKRRRPPEYVDNEWSLDGSNNITYEELCAYMGTNIILSVNPYHQLKHVFPQIRSCQIVVLEMYLPKSIITFVFLISYVSLLKILQIMTNCTK